MRTWNTSSKKKRGRPSTKMQMFEALLKFLKTGATGVPVEDLVKFVEHEIDVLDRKLKRTQREHANRRDHMLDPLRYEIYKRLPEDGYEIHVNLGKQIREQYDPDITNKMVTGNLEELYKAGLIARRHVLFPEPMRKQAGHKGVLYAYRKKKIEELSDEVVPKIPTES